MTAFFRPRHLPITALAAFVLLCCAAVEAQDVNKANGQEIFFSNCAVCHGMDGTGGRGPNLLGQLQHGDQDTDIANVIEHGVPGSSMPAFHMNDEILRALVQHVQTLRRGSPPPAVHNGDVAAGEAIYQKRGCANCHRNGSQGVSFGPDLTRIGAQRSYDYLKTSILNPSADIPDEYETVLFVGRDGRRIRGIRVNEDSFTIQLRLPNETYASLDKETAQKVVYEKQSFMPAYSLAGSDLENLLAYLSGLRTPANGSESASEPSLR